MSVEDGPQARGQAPLAGRIPVKRIAFRVDGKRVALRKSKHLKSSFTLRRLPKGRYRLEVVVTLADGRVLEGRIRYRACRT